MWTSSSRHCTTVNSKTTPWLQQNGVLLILQPLQKHQYMLFFRRTWQTWRCGKGNKKSRKLRKSFLRGSSSSSTENHPESRWRLSSGEWEPLQWNSQKSQTFLQGEIKKHQTDVKPLFLSVCCCCFQVFWWRGLLGQVCVHRQHIRGDRWDHHASNCRQTQHRQTVYQQVKECFWFTNTPFYTTNYCRFTVFTESLIQEVTADCTLPYPLQCLLSESSSRCLSSKRPCSSSCLADPVLFLYTIFKGSRHFHHACQLSHKFLLAERNNPQHV